MPTQEQASCYRNRNRTLSGTPLSWTKDCSHFSLSCLRSCLAPTQPISAGSRCLSHCLVSRLGPRGRVSRIVVSCLTFFFSFFLSFFFFFSPHLHHNGKRATGNGHTEHKTVAKLSPMCDRKGDRVEKEKRKEQKNKGQRTGENDETVRVKSLWLPPRK